MKQSQTNPVLNAFFHVSQRVQPSVDRTALIAAAQIDRGLLGAPRSAILAEITTPEARREHRSAARDGAPLRSYFFLTMKLVLALCLAPAAAFVR